MPELQQTNTTFSGPETGERGREARQTTAPHLWAHILQKHPEAQQIVLAHYFRGGRKEKVFRYNAAEIIPELQSGSYPLKDSLTAEDKPLMCSISSIVGTSEDHTRSLIKIKENPHPHLRLVNPKSFVNFDFSCNPNSGSLDLITNTLKTYPFDWYVLKTGKSYHAVIDTVVSLQELPLVWGDVLTKFSDQSASAFARKNGREMGALLAANARSLTALRLGAAVFINHAFEEIAVSQGGFEKFSETSILDWGHLAYSLRDLIYYYEGRVPGTGYLRIGPKGDSPPPLLVAQKKDGAVTKLA